MKDPKLLNLAELLETRIFKIPEYQRAYSWQTKQRKDLFDDILELYKKYCKKNSSTHFMSTLVCLEKDKEFIGGGITEYTWYDVVDGQQRLTTLVILLKAIEENGFTKGKDDERAKLKRMIIKEKTTVPILQTNHDSKNVFINYVRDGKIIKIDENKQNASDVCLLSAIHDCREFVKRWLKDGKDITTLVQLVNNKLYFLFHSIDDEAVVYNTFEVLNSRGLQVEWLDRFKSTLMGLAFENNQTSLTIQEMHNIWKGIYDEIGNDSEIGTMAMRYLATFLDKMQSSKILSDELSAMRLGEYCAENIEQTFDFILDNADANENCSKEQNNIILNVTRCSAKILALCKVIKMLLSNNAIRAVTKMQHARFLAIAIEQNNKFNNKEKEQLLDAWERSVFKTFGLLRRDSRFKVGDYIRIAIPIYKGEISFEYALQNIKDLSKDFSVNEAITIIKESDCYNDWSDGVRYLFYKRELYLNKKSNERLSKKTWSGIWSASAYDTIEHILPQSDTKALDNIPDGRNKTGIYKHRLGNLLVLEAGKNSSLQNMAPKEKIKHYNDLAIEKEVRDFIINNNKQWTRKEVDTREGELINWIKDTWA